MCHLPRTAWQNVCSRPCGIDLRRVAVDEHDAGRADRRGEHAAADDAVADGAGRAVARAADDHAVGRQAEQLGRLRGELAGDFFGFVARGEQARVELQLSRAARFDQRRLTTSSSSMPLASLTSVANSPVSRRRISSLGSSTFTVLAKFFGSWLRSQRIFGAVKPVSAGLATMRMSSLAPAGAAARFPHTRRPSAGRSTAGPGGRLGSSCRGTPSRASGRRGRSPARRPASAWPACTTARTVFTVACHQSSGSCSLHSGLGW